MAEIRELFGNAPPLAVLNAVDGTPEAALVLDRGCPTHVASPTNSSVAVLTRAAAAHSHAAGSRTLATFISQASHTRKESSSSSWKCHSGGRTAADGNRLCLRHRSRPLASAAGRLRSLARIEPTLLTSYEPRACISRMRSGPDRQTDFCLCRCERGLLQV